MKRLATSCLGLGWLPFAPGTWGSLPPVVVFGLLCYFGAASVTVIIVMAALASAGAVICVRFAPVVISETGKNDPREVVIDEFAGQAVTFLTICFYFLPPPDTGGFQKQIWAVVTVGFLLFRLFDIAKPWPIRRLEKLPEGWGILADDLLAGFYAGIASLLFSYCVEGVPPSIAGRMPATLPATQAIILGIVQGATEFLPVSSSGHLVLFENLFNFDPEKPEMLLFDLFTHVGTVAAIFFVFRKSIAAFVRNLFAYKRYGKNPVEIYKKSPSVHILVLAIVATFITGSCGLLLEKYFFAARGSLLLVALMWLITGTLLLVTDWRKNARLSLRRFGFLAAVVIGLAQAVAIMPGISRSGATICAAILIGLRRRWAVEFSFLLAIPAILGAALIESVKNFEVFNSGNLPIGSILTGSVAAAFTGILAMRLLIKTTRTANLRYFAFYCYILTFFVLVYLLK